jgi:DNA-binding NarL/FixJ family response regulator
VTRVFVVEDNLLMRKGLATSLARTPSITVVGEAESGEAAITALSEAAKQDALPNVVIMDIGLPGLSGLETTRLIKATFSSIRILMFTVHQLEDVIFGAFSSGADGYCLKDSDIDSLLVGVQAVSLGSLYVDPRIAHLAVRRILTSPLPDTDNPLSPREMEVLKRLASGAGNKEIAEELGISLSTVKAHIQNILVKLSATTRADAAVKAFKKGLL